MPTKIKKRDGRIVKFSPEKITTAILRAGLATQEFDASTAQELTDRALKLAEERITHKIWKVEEVQDIVEEVLMRSHFHQTAKAFIIYRDQHAKLRELTTKGSLDLVDQYLQQLDWQVNENSNMAYSLQGLNNYISSEISKTYWLNKIYTPNIKDAHLKGDFHLHDLNLLSVYCVGWDLFDLLVQGFQGVSGKIESQPPKHFRSALGQIVNFFYTLQGEAAGAQAFSSFDTYLAPFVRYDNLSYGEVKQALQEFVFNINVPTRVGFQTPFTNLTLDLVVPSNIANQSVIVGGQLQNEKYADFQAEMDIINKALLEVMNEGDAKGRVFTFPVLTYNITKDFDWDNDNISYLWDMTAKYGIPYFSNFVNSDLSPEDARSMCCRLRLETKDLVKRGGGLFGANPLTGSIGVVTINLPRIGYIANDKAEFLTQLGNLMDLAKDSLETKRKVLEKYTDGGLYPYTRFYLRDIKTSTNKYWSNHFSTIGLIGMNEASLNLFGQGIGTPEGQEFAEEVLDFMRDRLSTYQTETGNNYNLEATPAEGTSYRLAKKDRAEFPNIIVANQNQRDGQAEPFYTNSSQLPVNFTDDIFEELDLQDHLQTKYTGGTVVHLFLGEQIADSSVIKKLVKVICEKYRLPYFTFSPTFSICPNHGYISGEYRVCPHCGEKSEIYSRVVGYLRPVQQWNNGKKEEFELRRTFKHEYANMQIAQVEEPLLQ
jgi:ribonucleoside-triphosphate reductase